MHGVGEFFGTIRHAFLVRDMKQDPMTYGRRKTALTVISVEISEKRLRWVWTGSWWRILVIFREIGGDRSGSLSVRLRSDRGPSVRVVETEREG